MCLCTVVLVLAHSWVGCRWSGECAIGNRGIPSQMQPKINEGYEECTVFSEFVCLFSKQSNGGYVIRCWSSRLEHVRSSPFRFQNRRIIPLSQSSAICSVDQTWLKMLVSHVTTASRLWWYRCPRHAHSSVDLAPSELLQALCHRWCKEGRHLDG